MKRYSWMILTLLAVLVIFTNVYAQEEAPRQPSDDEVNAIAKQLYCPVCENIPLDVCSTQACAEWRDLIRLKLSQGWSAEKIKTYFADQYGERVLASPRPQGFNTWFYILGGLFVVGVMLLVGAFMLFRNFRAASPEVVGSQIQGVDGNLPARASPPASSATQARTGEIKKNDEYIALIEEELKKR